MSREVREFLIVLRECRDHADRFIARLERRIERRGDCRVYNGSDNGQGYKQINFRDERGLVFKTYAHRVFLIMMLGHQIPKGWHASHDHAICPYAGCVKHLYLEWGRDNRRERNHRQAEESRCIAPF